MRSKRADALLAFLQDRTIAYHPKLAKPLGGVCCALFVCQMLWWDEKGSKAGGWIYKTQADWTTETGMTRSNLDTARRKLKERGILEEKLADVPATVHYRLDFDRLGELLEEAYSLQESSKLSPQEMSDPVCANPANLSAETPQSIPETTTETTPKKEGEPAAPAPSPNGDPPTIPSSFREWEEWLKRVSNKPALVRRMCGVLYPDKELPAYGHIGTVAKKAGHGIDGYRRVMAVLWTLSVAEPAKGDLMPYVQRVIEGKDRDNGANRRRSKGKPPPVIDGWDKFDVPIPGHVDAG